MPLSVVSDSTPLNIFQAARNGTCKGARREDARRGQSVLARISKVLYIPSCKVADLPGVSVLC